MSYDGNAHTLPGGGGGRATEVGSFNVRDYGAIGDGTTDDTAAFNAAIAAMPTKTISATAFPVGQLKLGSGTYKLGSGGTDVVNLGPFVSVLGHGHGSTTLAYYGAGSCLRQFNSVRPSSDTFDTLAAFSGEFSGFTIDGVNCQAGASGLRYGDTEGGVILGVFIRGFNKTGCDGLLFDNQYSWTENMRVWASTYDCTNGFRFHGCGGTAPGGDNSFMYNHMDLKVYSMVNQNGVVFDNGAYYVNGSLRIRANMRNHTAAQTSALLSIKDVGVTGHLGAGIPSQISNCHLELQGETNGTGTIGPMTIRFGDPTVNYLSQCEGVMAFSGGKWAASNWSLATNYASGTMTFAGFIAGDANLSPADGGYTTRTAHYFGASTLFTDGGAPLHQGDVFGPTTLTQNMTISLQQNKGGPQRKTFVIKQAASGGPYTVTWPKPGSPTTSAPAVYWAGGTAPTMTATANATDMYELSTTDGVRWYGRATQNVS